MDGPKAVDALRGHAVREPVAAGAPLVRSAVVGPGQRGFLAAVLKPGTRAVTIRLGKGARHAGLIDPGDRVDVILTAKLRLEGRVQTVFARTILEDVRVVAVDRQVGASTETPEGGKRVKRTEILTATLEVSPAQADRLALGEHEGELSLAVRSLIGAVERVRNEAVDLQELFVPDQGGAALLRAGRARPAAADRRGARDTGGSRGGPGAARGGRFSRARTSPKSRSRRKTSGASMSSRPTARRSNRCADMPSARRSVPERLSPGPPSSDPVREAFSRPFSIPAPAR